MFNIEEYETVAERIKKFYDRYEDGRIITDVFFQEKGRVIMKATLYGSKEELQENSPMSTGFAEEYQGQGSPANKYSYLENGETSAIGRALANAGLSGNNSCSKEEMWKVIYNEWKDKILSAETKEDLEETGEGLSRETELPQRAIQSLRVEYSRRMTVFKGE